MHIYIYMGYYTDGFIRFSQAPRQCRAPRRHPPAAGRLRPHVPGADWGRTGGWSEEERWNMVIFHGKTLGKP